MFNGRVDMSQGAQAAFNSVRLYFWMSRACYPCPRDRSSGCMLDVGGKSPFGTSSGS